MTLCLPSISKSSALHLSRLPLLPLSWHGSRAAFRQLQLRQIQREIAASPTRVLAGWLDVLRASRDWLPSAFDQLSTRDVCHAIAALLYAQALEAARALHAMPNTSRDGHRARVAAYRKAQASPWLSDRYSVWLALRWEDPAQK